MRPRPSSLPLPSPAIAWLDSLRRTGRSPKTIATYSAALLNLHRFLHQRGIVDVRRIKSSDLETWQDSLTNRAVATREQFTRIVGFWIQWLVGQGKLFNNPAASLQKPKLPYRLVKCPSEAEMKLLLQRSKGRSRLAQRDSALLEIAYSTGARLAELAQLQLSSLDMAAGLVRLDGKGGRDRMVPLTRLAMKSIRKYLAKARGKLADPRSDSGDLFISSRCGHALTPVGISRAVASAGRRSGIKLRPHDIRRAFATHLLRGGAHPADVKKLLGHQSYRHLARYIASAFPSLKPKPQREKSP